MQEIINDLYIGNDADVDRAKEKEWSILVCAKEGPNGHRSILKYETPSAPKNNNYYFVNDGDKYLALNLIDSHDPSFIPDNVIEKGIEFIKNRVASGDKVLVSCNKGESRSPAIVMLYLRSINELPQRYREAFKIFKTIYDKFNPGMGIEVYIKHKFGEMKNDPNETK